MENPRFYCESCDYSADKLCHWEEHKMTKKHVNKSQQIFPATEYYCKSCDVRCSHLSVFNRHKKTQKHLKAAEAANISGQEPITQILLKENQELRNFIIEQSKTIEKVIEQNAETMNKVIEKNAETLNKAIERCNTTVNQTNNTNNKFNINMYLNEECKNAINFSDFIKNIEVSYEDLTNNAQLGFVNGISKIFIDNLNRMAINERPIHCTDVKREIMYIKDDGKWNKEVDDTKLQNAIKTVSYKSLGKLLVWKGRTMIIKIQIPSFHNNVYKYKDNRWLVRTVIFTIRK
jgi:hypothetical protein